MAVAAVAALPVCRRSPGEPRAAGDPPTGPRPAVAATPSARPVLAASAEGAAPARASATPTPSDSVGTPSAGPRPEFPHFLRPLPGEPTSGEASPSAEPAPRRELLFTFDDGPHLEGTPVVLDHLARRGIRAIFFVNGKHLVGRDPAALRRRAILRQVVTAGHLVANHTMNHVDLCREPAAIDAEIDDNAEIIAATTGRRPTLFRAPYGARCRRLVEALRVRRLVEVGWNVGGNELDSIDENEIVEEVAAKLGHRSGPAILLLHDSNPSGVQALPWILDFVDEQNQLLRAAGKPPWKIVGPEVLVR